MAYHMGLAEPQKVHMETAGRVALTTEDSQRLHETGTMYISVIIGGILIILYDRANSLSFQIFSGFFMLAIAEVVRALLSDEVKQKPKKFCNQLAVVLARFVGGLMVYFACATLIQFG
jgi:hypothetical protein